MYEELVKRLRRYVEIERSEHHGAELEAEAADAIETMCEMVAIAHNELANVIQRYEESKPRWIPVTVRLPEDGSDILAVQSCCGEVRIIPANYDRGVWYDCIFNRIAEHITHWMPLPEPPKEERKDADS